LEEVELRVWIIIKRIFKFDWGEI